MPKLVLSAKRSTWRLADDEHMAADTAYREVRPQVLARDKCACRFCGFQAKRWQEVHHMDDDHANNRLENLVTICGFCHMVFHVGRTGMAMTGEAAIVYAPEIPQRQISHLARAVIVAQVHGDDEMREAARAIMVAMHDRSGQARDRFGTCDGTILGEAFLRSSPEAYAKRAASLAGARLFPLGRKIIGGTDRMREIVDFWVSADGPFAQLKPNSWKTLFNNYVPLLRPV